LNTVENNRGRTIHVACLHQGDLTGEMLLMIARFKMLIWKYDLESQLRWLREKTEGDDRHLILFEDDACIGYLRLTRRLIVQGAPRNTKIIGVSTVGVAPHLQDKGYGKQLMVAANSKILEDPAAIGALCCASKTVPFYQKCGWNLSPVMFFRSESPETKFFQDPDVLTIGRADALGERVLVDGIAF
jgi:GNAT superfamily N-acetyltransferase